MSQLLADWTLIERLFLQAINLSHQYWWCRMMSQLILDWLLISLVVLCVGLFAAFVCGLTGRLPVFFLIRRSSLPLWPGDRSDERARAQAAADLRQRLADAVESAERRRLDGAMNVSEFRRRS